jgi:hypothetical protein
MVRLSEAKLILRTHFSDPTAHSVLLRPMRAPLFAAISDWQAPADFRRNER